MRPLGIEMLSVFGLPPVEFVHLAADLGCNHIGISLAQTDYNPHGYPKWSLREDQALRRGMIAAMAQRGVAISLVDGFSIRPGHGLRELAKDMEVVAELGATRVNTICFNPDVEAAVGEFVTLADMAADASIDVTLEFTPSGITVLASLPAVEDVRRRVGRSNFRLLIDTMHLARSGGTAQELAALPEQAVGYVQMCDSLHANRFDTYREESLYERMGPGDGELPLRDIIAAIPGDGVVGLEVPLRSQAEAGVGPYERLKPCVAAGRAILAEVAAIAGASGRF